MEKPIKYRPWTKAEDAAIRSRYTAEGPGMAESIGRTPDSVRMRAAKLGLPSRLPASSESRLTDERSGLAADYYPYALVVAERQAARLGGLRAQLRQRYLDVATRELVRAAGSYQGQNGAAFKTYLTKCILFSLKDDIRCRLDGRPEPQPIVDYDPPVEIPDDDAGPDMDFDEMIAGLPAADREVLTLCFREGLSQSKVATRLGISKAGVEGRRRRALERLRAKLIESRRADGRRSVA